MFIWSTIPRLLTIFAVVGLVAGVFASPGNAGPTDDMAATAMTMEGGMPPCDQTQELPDCCDMKACPFALVCVAKCPQSLPTAASVLRRPHIVTAIAPHDDLPGDSVALSPLGHPPKA